MSSSFETGVTAALPMLKRFALSLTRDPTRVAQNGVAVRKELLQALLEKFSK